MNLEISADVAAGLALVDGVDRCLLAGFARLGSAEIESLSALAAAFAGSPLETRVRTAVDAIGRNELVADSFLTLAIARTSLLGAIHDALVERAAAALGRMVEADVEAPIAPWSGPPQNLAQAARHWLVEVAIAGFARLETAALLPFTSTLERLLDDPALTRMSAVLVGWHGELVAACPVPDEDAVPLRRWADLWTRAMLLTVGAAHAQPAELSGTLTPVGLELRHHGHLASVVGHGLVGERLVRVGLQSFKVDVVRGPELFDLFRRRAGPVLDAFATTSELAVAGSVGAGGELAIREAKAGKPVDTGALADRLAGSGPTVARVPAADRHPLLIAIPIGGRGAPSALGLPVEGWYERSTTLTDELGDVDHWVGLLRWDGEFFVQPLGAAVKVGKKLEWRSNAAWAKDKPKSRAKPVLDTLRVKASKLLREKA